MAHLRTLGCGPITIFVCSCEICHFAVEISCFHDSGGCGIRAARTFGNNEGRGTSSVCCFFFWGGGKVCWSITKCLYDFIGIQVSPT